MAIADDIALYALGYWSHENHPFRIDSICLNLKQKKNPCSECSDACPQELHLHGAKPNWHGCVNCNLCVSACPTSAINQGSASFSRIRQLVQDSQASVSFACENAPEETCDERCLCLASLPWDLVAACALSGGVVLKAESCKSCPHEQFVAQVKQLVRDLRSFLGDSLFAQTVSLHDQPDKQRSSGMAKRMAFNNLAANVASGTENLLGTHETPTMSCYRALLIEVLENSQAQGNAYEVAWPTLTEDGSCRACEICTKLCPHEALELNVPGYTDKVPARNTDSTDAEENERVGLGIDEQVLIHNASKCTQCGLCYMTCPTEGLAGWDSLTTTDVPAYNAYALSVVLCEKCGHPFKPEGDETRCKACTRPQFGFGHTR